MALGNPLPLVVFRVIRSSRLRFRDCGEKALWGILKGYEFQYRPDRTFVRPH